MSVETYNFSFSKSIESLSIPNLPVLDTEEILEKIGEEWKTPDPFEKHIYLKGFPKEYQKKPFQSYCDEVFTHWITYCNDALRGDEVVHKLIHEGTLTFDFDAVDHYHIFHQAFPKEENLSKTIRAIRDAFSILISDEARNKLNLEKPLEYPTQETREKINTLVKQMFFNK